MLRPAEKIYVSRKNEYPQKSWRRSYAAADFASEVACLLPREHHLSRLRKNAERYAKKGKRNAVPGWHPPIPVGYGWRCGRRLWPKVAAAVKVQLQQNKKPPAKMRNLEKCGRKNFKNKRENYEKRKKRSAMWPALKTEH